MEEGGLVEAACCLWMLFFIVDSDSVDQKNTPLATALSPWQS